MRESHRMRTHEEPRVVCHNTVHFNQPLPCEQSQSSSPKRKIDSAIFVFCFVQEFGRSNRFKTMFLMCAALFILLTDD